MIVLISESLLLRSTARDGRLLRDRMPSDFCVRMHGRRRTFRVITGVAGKHFRTPLEDRTLMNFEDAGGRAVKMLASTPRAFDGHRPGVIATHRRGSNLQGRTLQATHAS